MTPEREEEIVKDILTKENLVQYQKERRESFSRFVKLAAVWIFIMVLFGIVWVIFKK